MLHELPLPAHLHTEGSDNVLKLANRPMISSCQLKGQCASICAAQHRSQTPKSNMHKEQACQLVVLNRLATC